MDLFTLLAEERIKKAEQQGQFQNLPGSGKPLELEDLSGVPEEMRMSYKILKNAGYVPPEVELQKEIISLRDLVRLCEDPDDRSAHRQKLTEKELQLELLLRKAKQSSGRVFHQYRSAIDTKFTEKD